VGSEHGSPPHYVLQSAISSTYRFLPRASFLSVSPGSHRFVLARSRIRGRLLPQPWFFSLALRASLVGAQVSKTIFALTRVGLPTHGLLSWTISRGPTRVTRRRARGSSRANHPDLVWMAVIVQGRVAYRSVKRSVASCTRPLLGSSATACTTSLNLFSSSLGIDPMSAEC